VGKSALISNASRKARTFKGLPWDNLCVLCFLFVHPLVSIPGRWKGKEGSIFIKRFVLFVFSKKNLGDLCGLCG
jgi:hypothetical protein